MVWREGLSSLLGRLPPALGRGRLLSPLSQARVEVGVLVLAPLLGPPLVQEELGVPPLLLLLLLCLLLLGGKGRQGWAVASPMSPLALCLLGGSQLHRRLVSPRLDRDPARSRHSQGWRPHLLHSHLLAQARWAMSHHHHPPLSPLAQASLEEVPCSLP